MRVIAGTARGVQLKTPEGMQTRPTTDRVKEALKPCRFGSFSVTTAEKHDEMIAFLSQLTHCIAVSLMCANDNPGLVFYTGDSFRDLTRIANINDNIIRVCFLLTNFSISLLLFLTKSVITRMNLVIGVINHLSKNINMP